MKRPWHIWTIFALSLSVVLAALGWLTLRVVRLEQEESEQQWRLAIALEQSELAGVVGDALWQMDTLLLGELEQQNLWPPLAYRAVYDDPYQGVTLGSPLLLTRSPYTLLHFEIAADGSVSSPQVPPLAMWPQAVQVGVSKQRLETSRRRLDELRGSLNRDAMLAALPSKTVGLPSLAIEDPRPNATATLFPSAELTANTPPQAFNSFDDQFDPQGKPQISPATRGGKGFQTRSRVNTGNLNNALRNQRRAQVQSLSQNPYQAPRNVNPVAGQPTAGAPAGRPQVDPGANLPVSRFDALAASGLPVGNFAWFNQANDATNVSIREGMSKPFWVEQSLFYARRVKIDGEEFIQGCLLNWPAIESWLLLEIADSLENAQLQPFNPDKDPGDGRALSMLPVRLVLPAIAEPPLVATSVPLVIYVAWGGVLLAALAVAGLLLGVMTLSERRATFVSAVTHELRTPLTTFRMYAEMLAEGMLRDEETRQHYLRTLQTEADRLTHLVENVLSYARVERGRLGGKATSFQVGPFLERIAGRLEDQVARAGMELVVDGGENGHGVDGAAAGIVARADAAAVEQIVVNLIDNATKYAAGCDDGRIHLQACCDHGTVAITVRDHGPGIDRKESRRLFRPFCKSAKDAAGTAPGVGLGLALSRRLAIAMGGSLRLDGASGRGEEGASFVLRLPLGSPQ